MNKDLETKQTAEVVEELDAEKAQENASADGRQEEKKPKIPFIKGILTLQEPLKSRGENVPELTFDFGRVTGTELMFVMESRTRQELNIGDTEFNNRKAKMLFAIAAAGSCGLDRHDIEEGLGMLDSITTIRLGKSFYNNALELGLRNIRNS